MSTRTSLSTALGEMLAGAEASTAAVAGGVRGREGTPEECCQGRGGRGEGIGEKCCQGRGGKGGRGEESSQGGRVTEVPAPDKQYGSSAQP